MNISILKFGGSALKTLQDFRNAAYHIAHRVANYDEHIVVVVSAMAGETDAIMSKGSELNLHASGSSRDCLMAVGETMSAALMAFALENEGLMVRVLNGLQCGIHSDDNFCHANVERVDLSDIFASLQNGNIVVVTGGQAATEDGRITYLGRNTSDLTAAIFAEHLGSREFEVFSKVPKIYSADPHIIPSAIAFEEISLKQISAASKLGTKAVHQGALEIAKKNRLRILRRDINDSEISTGTVISSDTEGDGAIVVLDEHAGLIRFWNTKSFINAENSLNQRNIKHYPFTDNGTFYISITDRGVNTQQTVSELDLEGQILEEKSMVALVLPGAKIETHVVSRYDSIKTARLVHDKYYNLGKRHRAVKSNSIDV